MDSDECEADFLFIAVAGYVVHVREDGDEDEMTLQMMDGTKKEINKSSSSSPNTIRSTRSAEL